MAPPPLRTRFDLFAWYDAIKLGDSPIAWCSAFSPAEALLAVGVTPVYPENHAAMLGALSPERDPNKPHSGAAIRSAEAAGFGFPQLCSYALADIGALLESEHSPIDGLPAPDLFYACDSQCSVVERWGEAVQGLLFERGRDIPNFVLRAPPLTRAERHSPEQLDDFARQLRDHLTAIALISGRELDHERLAEVVAESQRANQLWQRCLAMAERRPAPWTVTDAFQAMAPIVLARGTEICTRFYRDLLAELEERVEQGVVAVEDEEIRLLWDAIPIWPRKNELARFCAERNAAFVCSTYTESWHFDFAPERAFDSLVERYAWNTMNRSGRWVLDWTIDIYRRFGCDGIVCHWNESCGIWNSFVKRRLPGYRDAGIPVTVLHADMVDPRRYDAEAIDAQLGAFIDELKAGRATRNRAS